jgi:hypothetical protein
MNYIAIRADHSRTSMSSPTAGANDRRRAMVKRCPAAVYGRAAVNDRSRTLSRRIRQYEQGSYRDTGDRNELGSCLWFHVFLYFRILAAEPETSLHHAADQMDYSKPKLTQGKREWYRLPRMLPTYPHKVGPWSCCAHLFSSNVSDTPRLADCRVGVPRPVRPITQLERSRMNGV